MIDDRKRILNANFNIIIGCHILRLMGRSYNQIEELHDSNNNTIIEEHVIFI